MESPTPSSNGNGWTPPSKDKPIQQTGWTPPKKDLVISSTPVKNNGLSDYMTKVGQHESGGNPTIKSPTSSATGIYQFTKGTWDSLVNKYPNLGLTEDGITDPVQQNKAMQQLTKDNGDILTKNGIEGSNKNLYMAHFLGANGATSFINNMKKNPNQIAANLFPKEANVNDTIFYKDGNRNNPRTLKEVYDLQTKIFDDSNVGITPNKVPHETLANTGIKLPPNPAQLQWSTETPGGQEVGAKQQSILPETYEQLPTWLKSTANFYTGAIESISNAPGEVGAFAIRGLVESSPMIQISKLALGSDAANELIDKPISALAETVADIKLKDPLPAPESPYDEKGNFKGYDSITPEFVASNLGHLTGFVVGTMLTGGESAGASLIEGGMNKVAAHMIGNTISLFPVMYEDNYKVAKESMPNATEQEINGAATIITGATVSIFALAPWLNKIPGIGKELQQVGAKEFAAALAKGATQTEARFITQKSMLEFAKSISMNTLAMTGSEVADNLAKRAINTLDAQAHFNTPELSAKNILGSLAVNALTNIPFGGMDFSRTLKQENYVNKFAIEYAAKNPTQTLEALTKLKADGSITEGQFNNGAKMLEGINKVWSSIPAEYTDNQKSRIAPLIQEHDEVQLLINKLEAQKEVLHPTLQDSQDASIKELTDHQNKIKAQIDAIKNEKPEVPGELTLFHGSKKDGKPSVEEVKKNYQKVVTIDNTVEGWLKEKADAGDTRAQEILDSGNKYMESQPYLQELFGNDYEAVKFTNKGKMKNGEFPAEYFDLAEKKFLSTDSKHAELYSTSDRSGKYEDKTNAVDNEWINSEIDSFNLFKSNEGRAEGDMRTEDDIKWADEKISQLKNDPLGYVNKEIERRKEDIQDGERDIKEGRDVELTTRWVEIKKEELKKLERIAEDLQKPKEEVYYNPETGERVSKDEYDVLTGAEAPKPKPQELVENSGEEKVAEIEKRRTDALDKIEQMSDTKDEWEGKWTSIDENNPKYIDENLISNSKDEVVNKINAKYDAELEALKKEQPTKTTTKTELKKSEPEPKTSTVSESGVEKPLPDTKQKSWGDRAVNWYDNKFTGAKSVEDANNSGFFKGADKKVLKLAGDAAQKVWEKTKDISKAVDAFLKEIKKGYPVEYKYNKELFKAEVKKHVEENILSTTPEKKQDVKKTIEKSTGVKKEKKTIEVDEKKALKNKLSEIVKAQREESKKSTLGGMMAQGREMAKKIRKIEEGNAKNKEALINRLKKEHQKNTQKLIDAVKRMREGKEFQKKVADLIHSPVWKDKLNAAQVTALMDKASRVNSERSLKAFDDYARKVIEDANYATYLGKAKEATVKARKVMRNKDIPEYNRNMIARMLELNPEKVTDLTTYTKVLTSLQKELTGKKTGRDFSMNDIEDFVSKQHEEIKKAEDEALQSEFDDMLMKGVIDGSLSSDGKPIEEDTKNWTMKDFKDNMNAVAKKWTLDDYKEMLGDLDNAQKEGKITPAMKETMLSKLRDEVPVLKAQMESQRLINKETNPETPEERNALNVISRIDPTTADAKTLGAFNNVANNYIEAGDLSGAGKTLVSNQLAKERLDIAASRMIKVKQLRKGGVYKKSLTNIFKDLTYTKQNSSHIASLTTHLIKLIQSKAHRIRNEVFEKILDIAQSNGFDNKNNNRLSMFAFLNQEYAKKDGSTATFEDLIQHLHKSADNLIEEGRKKDKAENSSVINKVFKKAGVGKDYIDWGNNIKDILENDFKDVKSAEDVRNRLSNYEKEIYDIAAKFFSERAAKTQDVARLVENKSMPLTKNYFPLERLFKKGESDVEKGVYSGNNDVELYKNDFNGDFIDKNTIGSTISRKPLDENTIYNPQFLQVFAKKAFEQEFYNNGQQELYTLSSILNNEDFKKIVNEAWNPEESLTNHVMMKEKIVDVVDDWKNSGSLPNTASGLVEYLVKKSVSTVLNSVGQIPKQYVPNIRQSMQVNGVGTTVKAMSLRGGETGKARDLLLNAMSVKEAGGRGDILLEDAIYKEYFAGLKNKKIASVRDFFDNAPVLSHVLKLGSNAFKLGDQAGRNDVYISTYIKSLIDQGKIKNASEFDIFKEAENPNQEALSYAETNAPAIVNSSTSQERASILKDSNKSFTGKLSWTLMGYSLNSYQQAKSALRIVFDSRSTKAERWAAANDYYGFYSQLVAFGAMAFAYSHVKNLVSQWLAGTLGYETTDEEKSNELEKSAMRTGVKVVTDVVLSGQNIIGQSAGQGGVNWLYGQINQAATDHPYQKKYKGTIQDPTFKPFYQDGANIGIADMPVNLVLDVYDEAKSLSSSKDDDKEVPHDIQLSLLSAKLIAFMIENGDMYNLASKTQSIVEKKQKSKPKFMQNQLPY